MDKEEKHEHAKFLLYQIQQELSQGQENKDCVLQCEDGTFRTSSIVIFSLSPCLASLCLNSKEPVVIIPDLLMGELLLFIKYVFTNKIEEMFSSEDVSVIDRVCSLLSIDGATEDSGQALQKKLIGMLDKGQHHSSPSIDALAIRNDQENAEAMIEQKRDIHSFKMKRNREQEKIKSIVICPYCGDETGFTILSKHIKQRHPEQENTCLICHNSFLNRPDLESHLQLHSKEDNPYYLHCDRCDHVCVTQYQLQRHRKSHNIKKFKSINCQHCPRVFQVQDKYNKHLEQHLTGKENDEQFKCGQCGKQFSKQRDLDRHTKSHLGVKSYICSECNAQFVDSTRLKQHKWIHSNVKTFQCSVCDEMFRHKSHLNSHIASYHPESKQLNNILKCQHCNKKFAYEFKLQQHLEWHRIDKSERVECDNVEYSVSTMNVIETTDS